MAAVTALLLVAGPAAADPAGPTHFRSTITEVRSDSGGAPDIVAEVVGGDAYLVLDARGSEVEVPGYDGEPYLRFEPDGSVFVNDRSPARWLNDARFGAVDVEVPAAASADAPPQWRQVARGGVWSWHDHRIHFMSPSMTPQVDPTAGTVQPVLDFEIPVVVDGEDVVLAGELVWEPGPSPAWPVGAALVAVAVAVGVVVRGDVALSLVTTLGAVLALGIGAAATWSMPAGADVEPALLVLPGVGLLVSVLGRALARRDDGRAGWLQAAAAIPVGAWGVVQLGALTRPIVPGPIPASVVGAVVALVLGVGAAALVVLGRRILATTRVDPEVSRD